MSLMHLDTWNNGKYGRIWSVDDDEYSWKFTEVTNGCVAEDEWDKSPVIAKHFIGYCANNKPGGEGDIYTPFFDIYYESRKEHFRKKHLNDISLIRNPQRFDELFITEHIEEEKNSFEISRAFSQYDKENYDKCVSLYNGYMDYLEDKHPNIEKVLPKSKTTKHKETITITIDEDKLGKCFNAKFKGAGNNINHFESLVSDLKDLKTIKDFRIVATIIWGSTSGFIQSFNTFAKWNRYFFDCIGLKVSDKYNFSKKEQETDEIKRKFYYL